MPATLSTADFFARVHSLSSRIAVFDCDGTLWSGDAGAGFMHWSIENGLLSTGQTAWLNTRYEGYKSGAVAELDICGEMVQVYRGLREGDLREAAATFFRTHIEATIFPSMLQIVTDLQTQGVDIWAVSSSCDWVIEEGVRRFNIPVNRVLATRVAVEAGIVSHRLLDVPTDEGKVASLRAAGVTAPDAAFGNSIHDAAMLAIARRAFPVNPTPALVERAAGEDWPVYFPQNAAS